MPYEIDTPLARSKDEIKIYFIRFSDFIINKVKQTRSRQFILNNHNIYFASSVRNDDSGHGRGRSGARWCGLGHGGDVQSSPSTQTHQNNGVTLIDGIYILQTDIMKTTKASHMHMIKLYKSWGKIHHTMTWHKLVTSLILSIYQLY